MYIYKSPAADIVSPCAALQQHVFCRVHTFTKSQGLPFLENKSKEESQRRLYPFRDIAENTIKMTATFFATPGEFRKWLKKNHKKETELVVGFYKAGSGRPSITWPQSVDQALCFGWIDGIRKSIDKHSYCIRFTPRKSTSTWSAINIKKVEVLTKCGLMMPEGLKAFALRKENNSGIYSHENELKVLPPSFTRQFKMNKAAWSFFTAQAPSYKKVIIHRIMSAKQEKTRLLRLEKTIQISAQQKRML